MPTGSGVEIRGFRGRPGLPWGSPPETYKVPFFRKNALYSSWPPCPYFLFSPLDWIIHEREGVKIK